MNNVCTLLQFSKLIVWREIYVSYKSYVSSNCIVSNNTSPTVYVLMFRL